MRFTALVPMLQCDDIEATKAGIDPFLVSNA